MRKTVGERQQPRNAGEQWLKVGEIASVEITSEDPQFPIESAFEAGEGRGWRAAEPGEQRIRLIFDPPISLHHIRLHFDEAEVERTQEFTLRWSGAPGRDLKEIVRQQWNFSPSGSTTEVEDYRVDQNGVSVLELQIQPDISGREAIATLRTWRVA